MAEEKTNTGLLECLAGRLGCTYLSDLCQAAMLPEIQRAIERLDPEQYSLWEWNDAIDYIVRETHVFGSRQEAARFLRDYGKEPQETGQ